MSLPNLGELQDSCESFEQSRWIDDVCYYFHNEEVRSFSDAQKICSDKVANFGFDNGRLYEPRDANTFAQIYSLAEEFSNRPTLQMWLGLTDLEEEGQFRYDSNGQTLKMDAPWGGNVFSFLMFVFPNYHDSISNFNIYRGSSSNTVFGTAEKSVRGKTF